MICGEDESPYNQHYYYQHSSIDPIPSHPYRSTKLHLRALAYRVYPLQSRFHIADVTDERGYCRRPSLTGRPMELLVAPLALPHRKRTVMASSTWTLRRLRRMNRLQAP